MPIRISSDGTNWVLLEEITENASAWVQRTYQVSDFVDDSGFIQIRFEPSDLGDGSLVDAGVDDVSVYSFSCPEPGGLFGDLNDDCVVDGEDLGVLLGGWGQPGIADLNEDGIADGEDLGLFLGAWGSICL